MCALCNDNVAEKLGRREIRLAGMELIYGGVDAAHVLKKIKELNDKLDEEEMNDRTTETD